MRARLNRDAFDAALAAQGLTQAGVARALRVSRPTVSQWRSGRRGARLLYAAQLCDLLGLSVAQLWEFAP